MTGGRERTGLRGDARSHASLMYVYCGSPPRNMIQRAEEMVARGRAGEEEVGVGGSMKGRIPRGGFRKYRSLSPGKK